MYNIEPINIWVNGKTVIVSKFNSAISGDPMADGPAGSCKFVYYLGSVTIDEQQNEIVNWIYSDNVTMTGADYQNWNGSNDAGREWICKEIGVTLITGVTAGIVPTGLPTNLPKLSKKLPG